MDAPIALNLDGTIMDTNRDTETLTAEDVGTLTVVGQKFESTIVLGEFGEASIFESVEIDTDVFGIIFTPTFVFQG